MEEITREAWEELKQKYEQLKLNEEMYRVAVGLTDHTITVVDIPNRTLNQIYNEGDWTGIASSMPDAPESIISTGIIHPEDCAGYRQFYGKIYAGVPKGEFTMRVLEENRGWVWFNMLYQTVFDKEGNPLRAICFSDDITVEKKAEEKYQQYKTAVTANAEFVWEANLSKDILLLQEKRLGGMLEEKTFQSYTEISTVMLDRVTDAVEREQLRSVFDRRKLLNAFYNAKREISVDHTFDFNDGRGMRWLHSTAYLMTNTAEEVLVIICSTDITEAKANMEILEMKAERDALTGLYNRSSFESRVEKTIKEFPDEAHGFIMLDIDDFKHFNDNYGHAFGDSVLQLLAKVMQRTFRIGDYLGRFGGDEFMIFMKNVKDKEIIGKRAEHLLAELEKTTTSDRFPTKVTISMGVTFSKPDDRFDTLYVRADQALYESKAAGKNCFTIVK